MFCSACVISPSDKVVMSGVTAVEGRQADSFTKICLSSFGDVVLRQGDVASVELEGDENLLQHVETFVQDSTLNIRTDKSVRSGRLRIIITAPRIDDFQVAGSGSLSCPDGFCFGDMRLGISGSGNASLSGKASSLHVEIAGSGSVDAGDLAAQDVQVSISGTGSVEVHADRWLDASISGAGSIRYSGNPKVTKRIVGAGIISGV